MTFTNCLHFPRLLACILARLSFLDLQTLFSIFYFSNSGTFLYDSHFFLLKESASCFSLNHAPPPLSAQSSPLPDQLRPSSSSPPPLLCISCNWFCMWRYIQNNLCSCLFSLCASFLLWIISVLRRSLGAPISCKA